MVEATGVLCRAGLWEPQSPATWVILVAPTLLPCSCHPYTSQLCWSLGEEKPKLDLYAYPRRLGKLVAHSVLPSPVRGTLSNWEVPFDTAVPAWGMGCCRQNGVALPSLFVRFSSVFRLFDCLLCGGFFGPLCSLSFLSGLLNSPRAVFVHG